MTAAPLLSSSETPGRTMGLVRRVAVLGAECTGKTTLCETLSHQLPGVAFEEPLRRWVRERGQPPAPGEQHQLIGLQQQGEDAAEQQALLEGMAWVLCDSAPLMTAIYSETYYADHGLYRLALAHHKHRYLATVVCDCDLPWQADPGQRDGPEMRAATHHLLIRRLEEHGLRYFLVKGSGPERTRLAQGFLAGVDFTHR